ncbi:hypothetical protein [Ferrimonas pelagia]|uniref:Sel1 repeat family protein n=1 Tax=Ferrimonas pelagia TaxID=1177826 RepID=A0ABP9FMN8_9GAMM
MQAQRRLARLLLSLDEVEESKALRWALAGFDQGNAAAGRLAMQLLIGADDDALHDPKQAVAIGKKLVKQEKSPDSQALLAQAYFANGDKRRAVHTQKDAIKEAKTLEWALAQFEADLARFERG